jgi:hypothetical protein
VRCNLVIGDVAIYCTLVERNAIMVSLAEHWLRSFRTVGSFGPTHLAPILPLITDSELTLRHVRSRGQ